MGGRIRDAAGTGGPAGAARSAASAPPAFAELARMSGEERDELLDDALDRDMPGLVRQALDAFGGGDPGATRFALQVLDEAHVTDRHAWLRPEIAHALWLLCRTEPGAEVLAAALPLCGIYMPGPPGAELLLEMTGHQDPAVRAAAIDGIEYFADERHDPPSVMRFVQRLDQLAVGDPDAAVRLAAVEAFALADYWVGFEEDWTAHLVAALGRVLRDDADQGVRGAAAERLSGLHRAGGEFRGSIGETLLPYTEDGTVKVAAWSLARVASLGHEGAMDRLRAVLQQPDVHREYLSAATEAFVNYGGAPSRHRREIRKALKRLRKQGWADLPSPEPNWTSRARADYLDVLIDRL